jgi:hypothetical protein
MQTIQYVLKTGFGESTDSYGGTTSCPNLGLGQGSGASFLAFMALSSLIVNAYCRMGHGARICLSYVSCTFLLSTVMYVNNTDLLHWPQSSGMSPEELITHVQQVTWIMAVWHRPPGASSRRRNVCSIFLIKKFICGHAWMKSLKNLPPPRAYITDEGWTYLSHICIPQPTVPDTPIKTHDVATTSKMLGVHFSPAGNSSTHINQMVQKGLDWVNCLHTKPVSQSNAWLSFFISNCFLLSHGGLLQSVCNHQN